MKKIILFLLLPMLLTSCRQRLYDDTVSCETLCKTALSAITNRQDFSEYGATQRKLILSEVAESADCHMLFSVSSQNIDEIGVFHGQNEAEAKEIYAKIEDYLEDQIEHQSAFIASYAPEELPKLTNSEVRRFGNYVIYIILPEEDKEDAFDAIEEALKRAS